MMERELACTVCGMGQRRWDLETLVYSISHRRDLIIKVCVFFVFQDRKVLIKSFKGYYVKICKVRLKCVNLVNPNIQIQIF